MRKLRKFVQVAQKDNLKKNSMHAEKGGKKVGKKVGKKGGKKI